MADDVILGVHSNVRKGQIDPETGQAYGFDAGHAWISVTRDGKTTNYGLWPDGHPRVEDNGSGSDIRTSMEDGDTPAASRYYRLTPEQATRLDGLLKTNETWGYTNNCSSWARDTVEAVTGVHLNADDPGVLWTETPRQLGDSIHRLEEKDRTSPMSPTTPPPAKSCSSLGARADLSDTSRQLLQDSDQHVRRLAEQHGLPWDQGMDNTVAAVAQQARDDGLTGITHLKAGGGEIRFAQADSYGLKEGAVDAREAANTPVQESEAALAMADARTASQPATETRAAPQVEAPAMQLG
ncbi:XVIPCD domain-containing protein [Hydrogenophaga sp. MI9]|uniref:XVIPCD domain-containing protein n=1 Tax=Hydrogenophaga sp. MI9 TaxID=3453719 RepID=UPI003EEEFE7E